MGGKVCISGMRFVLVGKGIGWGVRYVLVGYRIHWYLSAHTYDC